MSDTWKGGSTDWFTASNWSNGAPTVNHTGTQSLTITALSTEPVIGPTENGATNIIRVTQGGVNYEDTQLDGQLVTLAAGAALTVQGVAFGTYLNATALGNISGLHGAPSATPTYDTHMVLDATGAGHTESLFVNDVNHNFGEISVGAGSTLNVTVAPGGNVQTTHGLYNYGLITIAAGGEFEIGSVSGGSGTVANFYNPGWIIDNGGTILANAGILDGADTMNSAGTPDGYIEIEGGGNALLTSSVAAGEQVDFIGTAANTLEVTAGTLFAGTVNNFGPTDTIIVNGFTGTSNATIVTVGGVTELVTTNGSVVTDITLTGAYSNAIVTGTNASTGQEYIESGPQSISGSGTLGAPGGTATNSGTITVSGTANTLTVYDSLAGNGAFFIDYGGTLALDNSTGNDAGQHVIFGTHGSAGALNTLIINDDSQGFGGAITGFGANDVIDLGASVLPALTAGEGIELSYAGGVLTVTETNASGAAVGSTALTLAGTAALATSSFVALDGPSGVEIEAASNVAGQVFTFSAAGGGSFELPANYKGGVAPGDVIAPGEEVTIAAGAASVSSGALVDNGTIVVGTSLTDAGAITGTGTLVVGAGAAATLAGGTTLGAIDNFGTIVTTGSTALGPVNMEGNGAGTVMDFTGTSYGTPLTNFGTGDIITSNFGPLPGGDGVALSYNTTSGVLTVTETNSAGGSLTSALVTVAVTPGDTPSFTALYGANGVSLELAASPAATNFTFTGAGGNTSFENPANFSGGFAPGDSLSSAQTVTIAAGTASVTGSGVTDNGNIIDDSTFIDTGSLSGTGALRIAAGDAASLSGGGSLSGGIADAGTLDLAGKFATPVSLGSGAKVILTGNVSDTGAIAGPGTLVVDSGVTATLAAGSSLSAVYDFGTLDLNGALTAPINLEGNGANSIAEFTGADLTGAVLTTPLTNFGRGDTVALGSSNFATGAGDVFTASYNTATSQLVVTDISVDHLGETVTLSAGVAAGALTNPVAGLNFVLTAAGGGLDISLPCFAAGTRILTPAGEVLVEDLVAGDTVVTVRENGPATRKVVWAGQRRVDISRHPEPALVRPVRIRAGAFGPGLPERDLRLSPQHAVYADGCLFEAASLVNGVTIIQEQGTRFVTYHHIELDAHDVMLAEGMPAESFADTGNKAMFEGAAVMRLHADFRAPADAVLCAPMVREGEQLERLRARLAARLGAIAA